MSIHTNSLINETSPYLLQHAHNPVNWYTWKKSILNKAQKYDKLLIISIGYATCHWCHVMEQESFADQNVASIMNLNFINIKVDREERPDIDQIYMDALNLLTGKGGWPLNIIALPNGKPIWGASYVPKEKWIEIIENISKLWIKEPSKLKYHADKLTQGIKQIDLFTKPDNKITCAKQDFNLWINIWQTQFDTEWGGTKREPKFPVPNSIQFLLQYASINSDNTLLSFVRTTLQKIAFGGIYDHIRGGFSRYATDVKWHIPHFEKMLYDNAQLVSLYTEAYLIFKDHLFQSVVIETLDFVINEMYQKNTGAFYSAIDADSLNYNNVKEEGAYYTWTEEELKNILPNYDFKLFKAYYNINEFGFWEKSKYVLIKQLDDLTFIKKHNITLKSLNHKKQQWRQILKQYQSNRSKPFLDNKTLTSWNALMLKGFLDAYKVFGKTKHLDIAIKNMNFILNKQLNNNNGGLFRTYKEGKASINAYLEDYAFVIQSLITLYDLTFDEKWIHTAKHLTDYTIKHFCNPKSQLFFFTSNLDKYLIHRKTDIIDNVIPSANAIMADNLSTLSILFNDNNYTKLYEAMLSQVKPHIKKHPNSFSCWMKVIAKQTFGQQEIIIVGKDTNKLRMQFNKYFIPNTIFAGAEKESNLPILHQRFVDDQTLIYICQNKTCQQPVKTIDRAIKLLNIKS